MNLSDDAASMKPIGTVAELRRYPVKSMLGELLARVHVRTDGLEGDRICALIDRETGRVASAKRPHRWRRLLECSAVCMDRAGGPKVRVTLPDGTELDARSQNAGEVLSAMLGREVTVEFVRPRDIEIERANPDEVAIRGADSAADIAVLPLGMAAPEGGFFDYAPLHFVTTSSLKRVAEHSRSGVAEPVRFRPNLVIETLDETPFVENEWVGGVLAVGNALLLKVILPTPRCAVPTLGHGSAGVDPQLTRVIGTLNKVAVLDMGVLACLGAYAQILRPGDVAIGDSVCWSGPPEQ
jgi:uncharacterized protein YcbX